MNYVIDKDGKVVEMQLDSEAIDPTKVVEACQARKLNRKDRGDCNTQSAPFVDETPGEVPVRGSLTPRCWLLRRFPSVDPWRQWKFERTVAGRRWLKSLPPPGSVFCDAISLIVSDVRTDHPRPLVLRKTSKAFTGP